MEEYEETLETFKRCVSSTEQKARECSSLLKFSEGLVKRDIDIIRIQIDLRLKKLERLALTELQQLYSNEKDKIEEILTNLKFLSERTNLFPYDYEIIADAEQELRQESEKLYRKRFVFETNKDLNLTLDKLDRFGRISVNNLEGNTSVNMVGCGNELDTQEIREHVELFNSEGDCFVHEKKIQSPAGYSLHTQEMKINVDKESIEGDGSDQDKERNIYQKQEVTKHVDKEHVEGENFKFDKEIQLERMKDIFSAIDPFEILRGMKMEIPKSRSKSCQSDGCGKELGNERNTPLQLTKHVKFSDEIDDKVNISTCDRPCNIFSLKQRGRMFTEHEKKRRARSVSPRAGHTYPDNKRDRLQSILKNTTVEHTETRIIHHVQPTDNSRTSSTGTRGVTRAPGESILYQKIFDSISPERPSEHTDTQAKLHNNGRTITAHANASVHREQNKNKKNVIQEKDTECKSRSCQCDNESCIKLNNISGCDCRSSRRLSNHLFENSIKQNGKLLIDKRRRNRSLTSDISKLLPDAREYSAVNSKNFIPDTKCRKQPGTCSRLRLPSFDEMLYSKY